MNLTPRDKRAVVTLCGAVLVVLAYTFLSGEDKRTTVVQASIQTVPAAEKRLERLRQIAASVPGKQNILDQVTAELNQREQGLIQADTVAQAQAQLLQTLRRVGRAQEPPVDIRSNEFGQAKPFGETYGEVSVTVTFDARIEQLVNLLADLSAQKELLATSEIHLAAAHEKQKTMPVRLAVSGLVRRELLPKEKKGFQF